MAKISLLLYSLFKKKKIMPLSVIGVLLILSLIKIYTTRFGTDLLSYIPEEAQKTKAYLEALKHSGGERSCYVIFKGNTLQKIELIDSIALELKKLPEITDVQYKVDADVRDFYLNMIKKNLPLYLNSEELDAFFERLTPEGMNEAIKRTRLRLMMLGGGEIGRLDPLGFTDFIKPFPNFEGFIDTASGYYMLQDNKGLILIASVSGDPRDIGYDHKLLTGIDALMKRMIKDSDNISVTVTGSHAITYYEAAQMKEGMQKNIFFSVLLVGAVLFIFVRKIKVMLYAFMPAVFAAIISLGFYSLVFGSLTEASGGFAAMLIGLGVDFAIILYVRNLFLKDMEQSIKASAPGIWAGALTTAATFSPMIISHFKGIKELGILIAIGIVFCAVVLFGIVAGSIKPSDYPKLSYNLSPLSRLLPHGKYRTISIAVFLLIPVFSLWVIKDMRFSVDLKELGSVKNPARTALEDIIKEDGKKAFLIGSALNHEDAVKKAGEVERALSSAGIKNTISIASLIPQIERQAAVIDKLKSVDKETAIKNFINAAKRAGFSNRFVNDYAEGLREMLSITKPIIYDDVKDIVLFKEKFLWEDKNGVNFLIITNNVDAQYIPRINGVTIADKELVKKELTDILKSDALKITLVGFFLVNLILFISFKRLPDMLFVQIPVVTAILFTGALLTLMGRSIHIMNAVTGIMLFGIGTDYAIHLAHHIRKEKDVGIVFSQTGTGVILSALTTICGFGSLYFSSYKGLSDMGLTITVGIFFCLIFSFLFLPFYKRK